MLVAANEEIKLDLQRGDLASRFKNANDDVEDKGSKGRKRVASRSKSQGRHSRKGKRKVAGGPTGHGDVNRSIRPNHMADLDKAVVSGYDRHNPAAKEGERQQKMAEDNIQTLNVKDSNGKAAGLLISSEDIRA